MRRYLRSNDSTRTVSHFVALDVETLPSPQKDGSDVHRLWFGSALHWVQHKGRMTRQRWCHFATADEFWTWLYSLLRKSHTTWLAAHYAAYDLTAVRLWREMEEGRLRPRPPRPQQRPQCDQGDDTPPPAALLCLDDPPTILDLVRPGGERLVCVDLMNWLPMPLADIAPCVGMEKPTEPGELSDDEYWRARNRADTEICARAMAMLCQWVRENDLGVMKYTTASQALAAWQHGRRDCPLLPGHDPAYKAVEREAYYPGLLRCFYVGSAFRPDRRWTLGDSPGEPGEPVRWTAPVYRLDVNGCYPAVMECKDYPVAFLRAEVNVTPRRALRLLGTFEGVARVTVSSMVRPYPRRDGRQVRWVLGTHDTTLCGPELRAALAHDDVAAVHELHLHKRGRPFGSFCRMIDEAKHRYRNEGNRALLKATKNMANALHGKLGQWGGGWVTADVPYPPTLWGTYHISPPPPRPLRTFRAIGGYVMEQMPLSEKDESYPLITAYTAAYAREYMAGVRSIAGHDQVYYQDVDSVHVDQRGYDALVGAGMIDQHATGKLKVEQVADWGRWRGPKNYCLDGVWTRAGIPPGTAPDARGYFPVRHFRRLAALVEGTPPEGPVTRDVPTPEPLPNNDGWIDDYGNVRWPYY